METIAQILQEIDEMVDEYRRKVKAGELPDLPAEYLIGTFSDSKQGSLRNSISAKD